MKNGAIKLFSFRDIDVKVHISFALIIFWAAYQWGILANGGLSGALFGIVLIVLLFVIVTLHEFGHSLAAQAFGIRTIDIVLWPLGGMARLEEMPRKPVQELIIAFAGPAVNLVLLVFLAPIAIFVITTADAPLPVLLGNLNATSLLIYLTLMNAILAIFNLIPAFPMDGGRVLRALLALALPYGRATQIAATIGQVLAGLLALWGFLRGDFLTGIVGVFIFFGARQEANATRLQDVLGGLTVGQAFSRNAPTLSTQDPLLRPMEMTLSSFQTDFAVLENGTLAGILTRADLVNALNSLGGEARVADVMRTDFVQVAPNDPLLQVQQKLAENRQAAAPVIDQQHYLGIITLHDIEEVFRLLQSNPDLAGKLPAQQ